MKLPVRHITYVGEVIEIVDADGALIGDCCDPEDARRIVAALNGIQPEGGRSLPPDMALLERCREICMRVSFEAEEAAKAKDATDYVAGYQDACVDIDEEIRDMMKERPTPQKDQS